MHFNTKIHPKFKLNGVSFSYDSLKAFTLELIKKDNFENAIGLFLQDWLSNSPTLIIHTSGSTGTPKPIIVHKKQMMNSALATGVFFHLKESDTALLCLPASYIAGKMMLVRALVLGLEIDYVDPSSNPLNKVSKQYKFSAMVPMQVNNSLQKLHIIDTLIIGGAAVSLDLKDKLKNASTHLYETYGMTETITHIALKEIKSTSFKTLPNVKISLDNRNCLVIDAPKVSTQIIITNDVVELVSESEFIWLGRFDNIINSGGIKLNPEQIEAKLSDYIKTDFFVSSLPDPILENKLVLLIEDEQQNEDILAALKESEVFTFYEIPKDVYYIQEFTRTNSGKIKRTKTLQLLKK
ncbi:O-succinylbenzoic acid--CoA ligase [Cellulophaga sp. RHA19]|uniref:AMP-binding protein n=1 Tax=Cellulophaga sp. RHA19 TaxID=1798237 RepID=UPI000C2B72E2|nr:AMP-binding protein [Cellulophaga sp. RHA19]PKB44592.1 O-succinylbenzoic acid--CoA ligase [Cellulophaga sp. RHA19]